MQWKRAKWKQASDAVWNYSITKLKREKILTKLNGWSTPSEIVIYMGRHDKSLMTDHTTIYFNSKKRRKAANDNKWFFMIFGIH